MGTIVNININNICAMIAVDYVSCRKEMDIVNPFVLHLTMLIHRSLFSLVRCDHALPVARRQNG